MGSKAEVDFAGDGAQLIRTLKAIENGFGAITKQIEKNDAEAKKSDKETEAKKDNAKKDDEKQDARWQEREKVRAFCPSSVDSRLNRSISSMTSMGMRTLFSWKLRRLFGSWRRTLVSRM